jgi:hypothetical protein
MTDLLIPREIHCNFAQLDILVVVDQLHLRCQDRRPRIRITVRGEGDARYKVSNRSILCWKMNQTHSVRMRPRKGKQGPSTSRSFARYAAWFYALMSA